MLKVIIRRVVLWGFYLIAISGYSQEIKNITKRVTIDEVREHLTFLASNELNGRDVGSPGIRRAAEYISSYYRKQGIVPVVGKGYFQDVPLVRVSPPKSLTISIGDSSFQLEKDVLLFGGENSSFEGEIVFAGYGSEEDLKHVDVQGKIVLTFVGTLEDGNLINALMVESPRKADRMIRLGAQGLVEIISSPGVPFSALSGFFMKERMMVGPMNNFSHLWMSHKNVDVIAKLKEHEGKDSCLLTVSGVQVSDVVGRNVIGLIPGTDKKLKDEYVVISAHYDHVGVGKADAQGDSIYNGARDNAIGTVSMMMAAKYFARHKPRRSILLCAFTAEEKGLLGSRWYGQHPIVPMRKTIFNVNSDGAGYNDTTLVTVIGLERTTAETDIRKACEAFGLQVGPDPAPEQNLYERSDNFNFASQGVPAVGFAPGILSFDQAILKYYHQPSDEVHTLDFQYLIKFFRAFVYANELLVNGDQTPRWIKGDKFEPISEQLYR